MTPPNTMALRTATRFGAATLFALLWLITGCGAPDLEYRPPIGVSDEGKDVDALSLTVVANRNGAATLVGTLFNHSSQSDQLVAVSATSPSTGDVVATTLTHGPVELPVEQLVRLADTSAVILTTDSFQLGYMLSLTLKFARADEVTLLVLVFPQDGPYKNIDVIDPNGIKPSTR